MKPIVVFKTLFFSFADLLVDESTASSLRENKFEPLIILLITYELLIILSINC